MTHIEAMKQGLEALEEAVHYTSAPVWSPSMTKECNEAITSLRQAIAEAEKQDPVMGVEVKRIASGGFIGNVWWIHENLQEGVFHLYTHPQPKAEKQEPVIDKSAAIRIATTLGWEPKREWVGLTDEEIEAIWYAFHDREMGYAMRFTRAIEAKLKQKNGYAEENT